MSNNWQRIKVIAISARLSGYDRMLVLTYTYIPQVAELSTGTLACHHDVAEFHFEDYQRVLHISGCTLR